MKKRYAFLTGIAISMIFGAVHAQTLNPDSMLGDTSPAEPAPEVQPAPQQPPQGMPQVFDYPITLKCMSMGDMRSLVELQFGQLPLAFGYNAMAQQQDNAFDGTIIVRNDTTGSYSIIIVSRANNAACIVAVGTELQLKSEQNTE